MDVWDAIQHKRAVRRFTDEPLPDAVVERILRAGRRAQSSKNTQPWHFIAVRDRDILQKLSQTGRYLDHVARAALCICIVLPDVAERARWIVFDAGQAAAYMQLSAVELDIGSVLGAIHQPDEARELLGFPPSYRCDALISFGYPAPEERRPPRGAGRKPLDELVHWDRW